MRRPLQNIEKVMEWIEKVTGKKLPLEFAAPDFIQIETLDIWHEQIFFEDEKGGNIGFFGDSQIRPDEPSLLHKYTNLDNKRYDDSIARRAVEEVRKSGMFKRYNFIFNNCQDFIESVKKKYFELGGK